MWGTTIRFPFCYSCCYNFYKVLHCSLLKSKTSSVHYTLKNRTVFTINFNRPHCFLVPYSSSTSTNRICSSNSDTKNTDGDTQKKPKKVLKTYITLFGPEGNMSISTLEEAKKIADRRNHRLIKVTDFDPKSKRAVYQLMTGTQYLKNDNEWEKPKTRKEETIKGDKLISISSNIGEHDALTKIKMIKKWLSKQLEVRVVITGDSNANANVYKMIETEIGDDGRLVQKRVKGLDIRFQIIPPKKIEGKKEQ